MRPPASTAPRSDEQLVAAAPRRGPSGHAAFAELVGRHRDVALPACRWVAAGQDAVAADAVQEGTLHALLALDRLRDPARFGAWLTGIALNALTASLLQAGAGASRRSG